MSKQATLLNDHQIEVVVTKPGVPSPSEFRLTSKKDPDILIPIQEVNVIPAKEGGLLLTTGVKVDPKGSYQLIDTRTGAEWLMAPSLFRSEERRVGKECR